MRVLAAVFVALGAGWAVAASPSPAVSPEDKHAGCLHNDLRPCMIALGSTLFFDMNPVAAEIAKRNELDVNGRTAHRKILINGTFPGHREAIVITLTLGSPAPNDTVVKTEVLLPRDPEIAHTPSEYDATYLYDVVSLLLGKACPALDKLTLYRFYENSLKPREVAKTEVHRNGLFNRTTLTVDTEKMPFCGVMFSLHREIRWDGAPDYVDKTIKGLPTSILME
jgi:hypothetical protein